MKAYIKGKDNDDWEISGEQRYWRHKQEGETIVHNNVKRVNIDLD